MLVLAAAQETGGANALLPVIRELKSRDGVRVQSLTAGKASSVFSDASIEHTRTALPFEPGCSIEELRLLCESLAPDVLLLGTAWGSSIDKVLLGLDITKNVPSVSVVDMWSNYLQRFTDTETGQPRLPTKIALMDDVALQQALDAGLPSHVLEVTGQPHLELIRERMNLPEVTNHSRILRREWLGEPVGDDNAKVALFVSERILRDFGPDTEYYRGYTEADALKGLLDAAASVEERLGLKIRVVVKLHPEEQIESSPLLEVVGRNPGVIVTGTSPWPCLFASDVVVGMTSMLLIESIIAVRPTISYQPGIIGKDTFIGTRANVMPLVSTTYKLVSALETAIAERPENSSKLVSRPLPQFVKKGSAKRIADLVMQLAKIKSEIKVR
jgi:hypothetical protein